MYHAYEQEGEAEKKQIVALHQQHVQAYLNKKKHETMEHYMIELQKDPVKVSSLRCWPQNCIHLIVLIREVSRWLSRNI